MWRLAYVGIGLGVLVAGFAAYILIAGWSEADWIAAGCFGLLFALLALGSRN
jgi:hypothetical protein